MWGILDTELYRMLSDSSNEYSTDTDLRKVYREFVETLIVYLDTESDNIKRIRMLGTIQVEFETIKSLELSYGAKKDVLKIVYSEKVLSLTNKELELLYRQMEYPKYFIQIDTGGEITVLFESQNCE